MIITVDPEKIKDWKDIFCYYPFHRNVFTLSDEEVCKKVEKLLADGKDPNASFYFGPVPGSIRTVPLCRATKCGYVKTVGKLLDAGADPNGMEDGFRPLYIAAENGYVEIVKILLAKGARVDDACHSLLSDKALHAAAEGCHGEIIEMLIKANANIETRDSNRNTPLILACGGNYMGKIIAIKKLIDAGADVEARNEMGKSPLHALAENFYFKYSTRSTQEGVEVIQWLVDAGADIHAKDKQGRQPLHLAAEYGNVEMVKKLLELGADPWAESYDHLVPLSLVKASDKETRKILLNAMKEHARKRFGQTKTKRVAPIKRVGRRKTDSQKLESERKVIDYS